MQLVLYFLGMCTVLLALPFARGGPVVIANADIRISFDEANCLPFRYDLLKIGDLYWGQDTNSVISVNVHNLVNNSNAHCPALFQSMRSQPGDVRFKYTVTYTNGAYAGSFEIHYSLHKATVFVTLDNVTENPGFHLIEIPTIDLVTLRQEDGPSSFVYNNVTGKLVDLCSAMPGGLGKDQDRWGDHPNISILPVVAFVKSKSVCTMEIGGFCNQTVLDVVTFGSNKHARIGSSTLHYQQGGLRTPDLIINQRNICRIDFAGDYDNNGQVNWLDAAKMVRDYMPPVPSHFMDDKYPWAIQGQVGHAAVQATFAQMEALTKRISYLIDDNPQVCYASGWTEGGQDTAYPNVSQMNTQLGGREWFTRFQADGKKLYNTTVSLDDNYDDQYNNQYTVGCFNPTNISRDINGNLVTFNAWNGVDVSYITGMAKYLRPGGPGEARVDFTAQTYGLQGSILIDAATWWTIRPDYDLANPASAPTDLIKGKFVLFDRFLKKYNIQVNSEQLRFPAVGHIAMTMDGPDITGGTQYGNAGNDIPFLAIAYRKSIYYGHQGGNSGPNRIANMLYNNNVHHGWLTTNVTDAQIADIYYNDFVPWFKLHSLDVLSFNRNGNVVDMALSSNSSVHIDFNSGIGTATYQGVSIINGTDITCPLDDRRIAFYSHSNKLLTYSLPVGSIPTAAQALYSDHRTNVPFSYNSGLVTVGVSQNVPVILYVQTPKPVFTWSAPVPITTADATLDLSGTIVSAGCFGATSSSITVPLSNGTGIIFKGDGSTATCTGQGAFTGANTNSTGNGLFNAVLNGAEYDKGPHTITLKELTVGQNYSVQLFALDDRGGSESARRFTYQDPNDAADMSRMSTMGDNVYVVGSFVATNTNMVIQQNLLASNHGNLNALVLRMLAPTISTSRPNIGRHVIGSQTQLAGLQDHIGWRLEVQTNCLTKDSGQTGAQSRNP
jgi:hypothetical protein